MIWHQQISFRKEGAEKLSPFRKGNIGEEERENNSLDVCYLPTLLWVNITGGGILIGLEGKPEAGAFAHFPLGTLRLYSH